MTYYLSTAILLILDLLDADSSISHTWKDPALKATVLLKRSLFLTEARHDDLTLEHWSGFKTDELKHRFIMQCKATRSNIFPSL